ncbi:MAG: DUF3072 domain-containing protein [Burkholderiaceae bacterium]
MTGKRAQVQAVQRDTGKRAEDWTTGDEPMTGAQRSYLKTRSEEAKVPFEERLTKAEASRRIDELRKRTGRGLGRSSAKSAEQQTRESGDGEADAHGGDLRGVKDR